MKFAYADPPYYGYSKFYKGLHDEAAKWDDLDTHRELISRLESEYADGWALSMTSGNLFDVLPLCPRRARIAAWVKPFASFKPGVQPGYTWEPVVFVRTKPADRESFTIKDHLAESITLQRGLTGAKPHRFNQWILDLLGFTDGEDTLDDLFPGTGGMARALEEPPLDFGGAA